MPGSKRHTAKQSTVGQQQGTSQRELQFVLPLCSAQTWQRGGLLL